MGETYGLMQDVGEYIEKQLIALKNRLTTKGIDILREVRLIEDDPYSPKLRDIMGRLGNNHYRES